MDEVSTSGAGCGAAALDWFSWLWGGVTVMPRGEVLGVSFRQEDTFCAGRRFDDLSEAADYVERVDAVQGIDSVWARVTSMDPMAPGRGAASASRRLPALMLDLDLNVSGMHRPAASGLGRPESWDELKVLCKDAGMPDPSAWVHSGGGMYPVWRLSEPAGGLVLARAEALLLDLNERVIGVARERGWHVDNIKDLARILRVPGSTNRKDPLNPRPCQVVERGDVTFSLDEIEAASGGRHRYQAPAPAPRSDPFGDAGTLSEHSYTESVAVAKLAERLERFAALRDGRDFGWNNTLNATAMYFGHFIVPGFMSRTQAETAIWEAAESNGMTTWRGAGAAVTVRGTIRSGLDAGERDWKAIILPDRSGVATAPAVAAASAVSLPEEFWTSRPELAHIRAAAWARMLQPTAVLGNMLLRVLCHVSPSVQLPPTVGSPKSLNLAVGLVAASGGGKTAAAGVARELLPWTVAPHSEGDGVPLGTGEGMNKQYGYRPKATTGRRERGAPDVIVPEVVRTGWSVLFQVAEVSTFNALAGRQGSTLPGQIRAALDGDMLGFAYSDMEKRVIIPAHRYRFTMVMDIQPALAAPLMAGAEADGGTPQRFVWFSAQGAKLPSVEDTPSWPGPLGWRRPAEAGLLPALEEPSVFGAVRQGNPGLDLGSEPSQGGDPFADVPPDSQFGDQELPVVSLARERLRPPRHMGLPEVATSQIVQARRDSAEGREEALDGHALLVRLKVGAALALLAGRLYLTEQDWHLAGMIMDHSDAVRASVLAGLADRKQGEAQARRDETVRTQRDVRAAQRGADDDHDSRAWTRVETKLRESLTGSWQRERDVTRSLASRDRLLGARVLEAIAEFTDEAPTGERTRTNARWVRLAE